MLVNIKQATDYVRRCMAVHITPMLWGDPGIGKSSVTYALAKKFNLKVIDVRLSTYDPCDLNGFPKTKMVPYQTKDGVEHYELAYYVPMSTFPTSHRGLPLDGDGVEMNGWLLFLDEFSSAAPSVEAAAYKLILDHKIGEYELHDKVYIMCAGNITTSGAIARKTGTAMQSRLAHFNFAPTVKEWLMWADTAGIDHRIKAYISKDPNALHVFKPDHDDHTFACQRTWEFCSKLCYDTPTEGLQELIPLWAGVVGESAAHAFVAFSQIYNDVPDFEDIVKDPLTVEVPTEAAAMFAVCHMIGQFITPENAEDVMKFLTRMGEEWQTIALQGAVRRDKKFIRLKVINKWMTTTGMLMN